jgi:hypothetical protein
MIHTYSFIYNGCYTIIANDSPIKWQQGKVDFYVTTGFCNGVNVTCTLLACNMVQIGSYLLKFQDNLLVPSSGLFLDSLILEDRTNRLPQNVGK